MEMVGGGGGWFKRERETDLSERLAGLLLTLWFSSSSILLIYPNAATAFFSDYCHFVVSIAIRRCESSNFVLFQDSFGYSGSLHFHLDFWTCL